MFHKILQKIKDIVSLQHYAFIGICVYFLFIFFVASHACPKCTLSENWAITISQHVFNHRKFYDLVTKGLIGLCGLEVIFALYMAYKHIRYKSFYI